MELEPRYSLCSKCRKNRTCTIGNTGRIAAYGAPMVTRVEVVEGGKEFADPSGNGRLIGILRSGLMRVDKTGPMGARHMLGLVLPGEPVGELLPTRSAHTFTALADSRICRFHADSEVDFVELASQLRHRLLTSFLVRLARLQTILWIRATLSVKARVAALLLMAARITEPSPLPHGGVLLDLVLPRQDAADLLSTTVESFCRALRSLERSGLIVMRDSHRFELCDQAGLERLSALDASCLDTLFPRERGDGSLHVRTSEKAGMRPTLRNPVRHTMHRPVAPTGQLH